jgi:hypothetical protein
MLRGVYLNPDVYNIQYLSSNHLKTSHVSLKLLIQHTEIMQ